MYPWLPHVGAHPLPELRWVPTQAKSSRHGSRPRYVFAHRWAGGTIESVVSMFKNPANQASSHVVYAGEKGRDAGKAVQMVRWSEKAWTEYDYYNRLGLSIEFADAIWLGSDPIGFAIAARMIAALLHFNALPPTWVHGDALHHGAPGFLRHADGGAVAGGHTQCPTTDLTLWHQFADRVRAECRHGGFRASWGRA